MIEIFCISTFSATLTGLIMGLVLFFLLRPKSKKPRKKRNHSGKPNSSAMNSAAVNAAPDEMKIKTAEIEIPVIAEDVLTYEPGELGESYPERTRLYYAADAIKDPEYLETVLRSPFQVETHGKNTGEHNRDVDGWPRDAWWDEDKKKVMVRGYLHGENNVQYAKENKHLPGFGTSAYITFLKVDRTPGVAPNGKPYDAIVRKAVNNHIAILPNIRDPKNAIVAMNAIETEKKVDVSNPSWVADDETWEKAKEAARKGKPDDFYAVVTDIYKKMGGHIAPGSNSMDSKEFRSHYNAMQEEDRRENERIRNAVNELEKEKTSSSSPASSGPVTSTATGGNSETSTSTGTAGNAPESSGPESAKTDPGETSTGTATATASNALPSEDMVKDFSTHLGVQLVNPTLSYLGSLVGIKETETAGLISALNAKREEFKSRRPAAAQNSAPVHTVSELLNTL